MLPMKVRARFRIHDTSGCSIGRGAEEEVRPETRVLGPRERDMKDDAKSGELGTGVSGCGRGEIRAPFYPMLMSSSASGMEVKLLMYMTNGSREMIWLVYWCVEQALTRSSVLIRITSFVVLPSSASGSHPRSCVGMYDWSRRRPAQYNGSTRGTRTKRRIVVIFTADYE
jgi:hypothetical protein